MRIDSIDSTDSTNRTDRTNRIDRKGGADRTNRHRISQISRNRPEPPGTGQPHFNLDLGSIPRAEPAG